MALGLKDPALFDFAKLADRAVSRAEHCARGAIERTSAVFQGAGKEIIEVGKGAQVFDLGFAHVDLVLLGKPGDQAVLEPARAAFGCAADQAREQVVRQQVLAEDKQAIFHWRSLKWLAVCGYLALDRGVRMVAPLAPGAGVGFYPWIAEELGD